MTRSCLFCAARRLMYVGTLLLLSAVGVRPAVASPIQINFAADAGYGVSVAGSFLANLSCCATNVSILVSGALNESFGTYDASLSYPESGYFVFFGSLGDELDFIIDLHDATPNGFYAGYLSCNDACLALKGGGMPYLSFSGTYTSSPTPEPSSLLLVGTGLLGLGPLLRGRLART